MEKGKAFAVVGHKHWGKSTTLLLLTDGRKLQHFTIKGREFCIKRMSNDDVPASFFLWLKKLKVEDCPGVIIALCPTFLDKRLNARLVAALTTLRTRYDLFFFVLRQRYKPPADHIKAKEIEGLEKLGKVKLFNSRAEGKNRAAAFKKFIITHL
jgi:hypothetical protein